jgi:hypothetical protein
MVDVLLREPVRLDSGEALSHYTRTYYVRADTVLEAKVIVAQEVTREGGSIIGMDPVIGVAELPAELSNRALTPSQHGIVWRSGRAFYFPE